jgi:hypothetical protein
LQVPAHFDYSHAQKVPQVPPLHTPDPQRRVLPRTRGGTTGHTTRTRPRTSRRGDVGFRFAATRPRGACGKPSGTTRRTSFFCTCKGRVRCGVRRIASGCIGQSHCSCALAKRGNERRVRVASDSCDFSAQSSNRERSWREKFRAETKSRLKEEERAWGNGRRGAYRIPQALHRVAAFSVPFGVQPLRHMGVSWDVGSWWWAERQESRGGRKAKSVRVWPARAVRQVEHARDTHTHPAETRAVRARRCHRLAWSCRGDREARS